MDTKRIKDALESQAKRCEIGVILCDMKAERLIPTVLEDIHEHSQESIDLFCVVRQ